MLRRQFHRRLRHIEAAATFSGHHFQQVTGVGLGENASREVSRRRRLQSIAVRNCAFAML